VSAQAAALFLGEYGSGSAEEVSVANY